MKFLLWEIKYIGLRSDRKIRRAVIKQWLETDKIQAIKLHRHLTGSALKDAKFYCDGLHDEVERKRKIRGLK